LLILFSFRFAGFEGNEDRKAWSTLSEALEILILSCTQ
jgi:hypothetical protein